MTKVKCTALEAVLLAIANRRVSLLIGRAAAFRSLLRLFLLLILRLRGPRHGLDKLEWGDGLTGGIGKHEEALGV